MTDYINREDAIKAFDPLQRQDWYTPWIVETLKDLTSADVAPVRHGRWEQAPIFYGEDGSPCIADVCTECGAYGDYADFKYCPNCGARMDGDDNEID